MEHVQRYRVWFHLDQGHCQVDEVLVLLSHSHDPAGTDFQSCRSRVPDGAESVLEGVGGADGSMKGFTRIQVVVHPIDARRLQSLGLLFVHEAQ